MKSDRKRQVSLLICGIFKNGTNELIYRTGDLPGSEIKPASLTSPTQADSLPLAPPGKPLCIYGRRAVRRSPVLLH